MKNLLNKYSIILLIPFLSLSFLSSNAYAAASDSVELSNTVGAAAKKYTHKKGRKNAEDKVTFVSGENVAYLKPVGDSKVSYKCSKAGKGKYSILTLKSGRPVTVYMIVSCDKKKKKETEEDKLRRIEREEVRVNIPKENERVIVRPISE